MKIREHQRPHGNRDCQLPDIRCRRPPEFEGKEEIRIMLRTVTEIESIADSCNNLARGIKRRNEGKSEFTDEQNHNIDQMFALLEKSSDTDE